MVHEIDNLETIREGKVLVDFYTETCGPCKTMAPVLEEVSEQFSNVKFAKVELTRNPMASQMFGVMSVPTVMFLQDSQVKEVQRGLSINMKEDLKSMVQKHLN